MCLSIFVVRIVVRSFPEPLLLTAIHPLALASDSFFAYVSTNSVLLACFPLSDILSTISPDKRAIALALIVDEVA